MRAMLGHHVPVAGALRVCIVGGTQQEVGTYVQLETPKLRGPGMSGGTEVLPVLSAHSLLISDPLPPSGESPIPSQCPGVSAERYVCLLGHPTHVCLGSSISVLVCSVSQKAFDKSPTEHIVRGFGCHMGALSEHHYPTTPGRPLCLSQVWSWLLPSGLLASGIPSLMVSCVS